MGNRPMRTCRLAFAVPVEPDQDAPQDNEDGVEWRDVSCYATDDASLVVHRNADDPCDLTHENRPGIDVRILDVTTSSFHVTGERVCAGAVAGTRTGSSRAAIGIVLRWSGNTVPVHQRGGAAGYCSRSSFSAHSIREHPCGSAAGRLGRRTQP